MRDTGPVTQQEYHLEPGTHLVSTTDLKGRILHCNADFVAVSGYARHELLGQPHNIIRHPDMPEAAFADLWATLGRGKPWSGLVKNRRKNGDHYWVRANVTPILEGERCVGYMSVRTWASPADTEAAGRLYQRLREQERQGGPAPLRLVEGRLRHAGLRGLAQRAGRGLADRATLLLPPLLALAAWALGRHVESQALALGAAAVLAAAAALMLRRGFDLPLQRLVQAARRMAAGDLAPGIDPHHPGVVGELEAALSQTCVNLRSIVSDACVEVDRMESAIGEIATGSEDLSGRTESQAASLEQTTAAMDQLTTAVGSSAASAGEAATLADRTATLAADGAQAVGAVQSTMGTIRTASQRIADITALIDTISFQTNLLALNAAVEAARAGDQGRGFAVVAGEVRLLAQRTRAAAGQVREIAEDAQSHVAGGVDLARRADERMADALGSVRHVSQFVGDIRNASEHQRSGIAEVGLAITQLNGITQQNAALVQQLSASSAALRERAQTLRASMRVLQAAPGAAAALPDAVQLRRAARALNAPA